MPGTVHLRGDRGKPDGSLIHAVGGRPLRPATIVRGVPVPRPYTLRNRRHWDRISVDYQVEHTAQLDAAEPSWGAWSIPERELGALGEVRGLDTLEVGCGAAQWSVHLARAGARATGLDISPVQLGRGRELVARARVPVRLVEGDVEDLPFPDASFDLVFGDHGALTFADPNRSLVEIARVLRPGGHLAFCITSPLLDACWDERRGKVTDRLVADYFAMRVFDSEEETSFQLPYGAWIRLFVASGFAVVDLLELQPPAGARTTYEHFAPLPWARRWPAEVIWRVRKL